mmetsp:Transcript_34309/g.72065  ORF Transcript_34309/g.72065 Transcript_34309/m.72065 type:complete len:250 (+) Transcript_34309:365-1114(+)
MYKYTPPPSPNDALLSGQQPVPAIVRPIPGPAPHHHGTGGVLQRPTVCDVHSAAAECDDEADGGRGGRLQRVGPVPGRLSIHRPLRSGLAKPDESGRGHPLQHGDPTRNAHVGPVVLDGAVAAARLSRGLHVLAPRLVLPRARGFGHVAAAAPDLAAAVGERGAVEGEHSDAAVRNALLHALHRRPAARARGVLHGHAVSGRPAAHRAHVRPGSEYAGRGQLQAVLLRGDERGADGELQRGVLSREQIS